MLDGIRKDLKASLGRRRSGAACHRRRRVHSSQITTCCGLFAGGQGRRRGIRPKGHRLSLEPQVRERLSEPLAGAAAAPVFAAPTPAAPCCPAVPLPSTALFNSAVLCIPPPPCSFLNKKPWHPQTFKNQARVWEAEHEDYEKEKRLLETRAEYEAEQAYLKTLSMLRCANLGWLGVRCGGCRSQGRRQGQGSGSTYVPVSACLMRPPLTKVPPFTHPPQLAVPPYVLQPRGAGALSFPPAGCIPLSEAAWLRCSA
jgi:hypothetical protein